MLAATATRFSPSDMWRKPNDEGTKGILTMGSWRERRVSQESGEKKSMLGNWRMREQKEAAEADRPTAVYGGSMPPEWKLVAMYKQLKVDNAEFTKWLVESVYPSVESLPSYITLSGKQAEDYSKYDILVNRTTELARQPRKIPPTMLALLDRLINERAEYTHWMSQKSTDDISSISAQKHLYYIEVLKETRTILAERTEPEANLATHTNLPPARPPTKPSQTDNNTLGKRKSSFPNSHGSDQKKAARTEATTPKPLPVFKGTNPLAAAAAAEKTQQAEWRQVVAKNCNSTTESSCGAAKKPMSYAAAARAITA